MAVWRRRSIGVGVTSLSYDEHAQDRRAAERRKGRVFIWGVVALIALEAVVSWVFTGQPGRAPLAVALVVLWGCLDFYSRRQIKRGKVPSRQIRLAPWAGSKADSRRLRMGGCLALTAFMTLSEIPLIGGIVVAARHGHADMIPGGIVLVVLLAWMAAFGLVRWRDISREPSLS